MRKPITRAFHSALFPAERRAIEAAEQMAAEFAKNPKLRGKNIVVTDGNSSFALNLTQERIPRPKNCPRLFRPSANHQGLQMARYFFHIDDGCTILDDQGLDLPSLEAARLEAVMACGEMRSERAIPAVGDRQAGRARRQDVHDYGDSGERIRPPQLAAPT